MTKRHLERRFAAMCLLLVLSLVPLLYSLKGKQQSDVTVYEAAMERLFQGQVPYRDYAVEYPPYAIIVFAAGTVAGFENYQRTWMLLAMVADIVIKLLLYTALPRDTGYARLIPVIWYSLGVTFLWSFYLQRYDVWPSLLTLLALNAFVSRHWCLSATIFTIAAGFKAYPAVLALPCLFFAMRFNGGTRFMLGLFIGSIPLLLSSFLFPWWHFAEFQAGRGIHVESLYGGVLWLMRYLTGIHVSWEHAQGKWFETTGHLAEVMLPFSKATFAAVTLGSMIAVMFWARSLKTAPSLPVLSRFLLIPLLAFVAFSPVLSPQFLVWLLPLAALAFLCGNPWTVVGIPVAAILTPGFYPVPEYFADGLTLRQTLVLCLRNGVLVATWIALLRDFSRDWRSHSEAARGEARLRRREGEK